MMDLGKEFFSVWEGREVWQRLRRKYDFTDMIGLVLFPSLDLSVNREAAALLPSYMEERGLHRTVAVTNCIGAAGILTDMAHENVALEKVSYHEMNCLLKYYRLVQFCVNLVVVSLEEPFGNDLVVRDGRTELRSFIQSWVYRDSRMEFQRERIRAAINRFADSYKGESVIIYGCTGFARQIYMLLSQKGIAVNALIDNDIKKVGEKYLGVDIFSPEAYMLPYDNERQVIVCSAYGQEMLESLYDMGYGDKNILYIKIDNGAEESVESIEDKMGIVRKGVKCYQRLQSEYGNETLLLVAPEASGDVFLAFAFLRDSNEIHNVNDYVVVGVKSNLTDIAELYDLCDRVKLITAEERENLLVAYMFMGERMNVKFLSGWSMRIRNSFVGKPKSPFLFLDAFRYETFGLMKEVRPRFPEKKNRIEENKLKRIRKGKTVIIAPYAYSSQKPMIAKEVWGEIAGLLCKKGYSVFTVGYGEEEPPIEGTLGICFSYKEACDILEYAGGFLAARSGLCDIVHMAQCRQLIVYGKNIRNEYSSTFFSLKRNYPDFKGEEIVFDNYEELEFIRFVADFFAF